MANQRVDVDSVEDFELEPIFEKAVQFLNHSSLKLKDEDKLFFYAQYKQATVGACNTPRPGMFDFVGKAKWDAWNALGKQDKEQSMRLYIKKLTTSDPDWSIKQIDPNQPTTKKSEGSGGPVFSRMADEEEEEQVAEDKKDLIYHISKGNASKATECLQKDKSTINNKDDQGLAALHYACDGGRLDLVELLLNNGANINLKDEEGQTPLHYACLVGHEDIVKLLLSRGADASIQDSEGQTPKDVASEDIQGLFS